MEERENSGVYPSEYQEPEFQNYIYKVEGNEHLTTLLNST